MRRQQRVVSGCVDVARPTHRRGLRANQFGLFIDSNSTGSSSQVGSTEGADTRRYTSAVLEESKNSVVDLPSYGPVDGISFADQRREQASVSFIRASRR